MSNVVVFRAGADKLIFPDNFEDDWSTEFYIKFEESVSTKQLLKALHQAQNVCVDPDDPDELVAALPCWELTTVIRE